MRKLALNCLQVFAGGQGNAQGREFPESAPPEFLPFCERYKSFWSGFVSVPVLFICRANSSNVQRERRIPGIDASGVGDAGYVGRKGRVNIGGVRKNAGKMEPSGSGFQFPFLLPQIVIDFYGVSFGDSEASLCPFRKPDRFIRIGRRNRRGRALISLSERSAPVPISAAVITE